MGWERNDQARCSSLGGPASVGLAVTAPGVTPQVEARTAEAHTVAAQTVAARTDAIKGEPMEVRNYGAACSERGWPYFETSCLRDANSPTHEVRAVRMVGTDRVPARR
jgi:hypothetical protein